MSSPIIAIIALFLLAGCLDEWKPKDTQAQICFDIISVTGNTFLSPMLINKCTGETWMALGEPHELAKGETIPGRTYRWYKVYRTDEVNALAGR